MAGWLGCCGVCVCGATFAFPDGCRTTRLAVNFCWVVTAQPPHFQNFLVKMLSLCKFGKMAFTKEQDTSGGSTGGSGRRAWLHMLQGLLQIHSHFVLHFVTFPFHLQHAAGSGANGGGGPGSAPGHARSARPSGAQTRGHSQPWRRSGAFAAPTAQGAHPQPTACFAGRCGGGVADLTHSASACAGYMCRVVRGRHTPRPGSNAGGSSCALRRSPPRSRQPPPTSPPTSGVTGLPLALL